MEALEVSALYRLRLPSWNRTGVGSQRLAEGIHHKPAAGRACFGDDRQSDSNQGEPARDSDRYSAFLSNIRRTGAMAGEE